MSRSLIIVNQLFQVMVAAHLRKTILKNEKVDLLLIDSCVGIKEVYKQIGDTTIFNNIYIEKNETFKNTFEKITKSLYYLFDRKYAYLNEYNFKPSHIYSKIFINNFTLYACELVQKMSLNNPVELFRFEEGCGSYLSEFSFVDKRRNFVLKTKNFLSLIFNQPQILKLFKGHYFFSPELIQYKTRYNIYGMTNFDFRDKEFQNYIVQAYRMPEENEFDRKYIFFEENIPDGTINDFDLVMKIAEKVGKENLIVKLHPRRPIDRFSKYGIKVSKSVGIPWEALLMKYDFSDKVIMTISSSVAFSSRLYFNLSLKTFMLFRVAGGINPYILDKEKYYGYIKSFRRQFNDTEFRIPSSIDDLLRQL